MILVSSTVTWSAFARPSHTGPTGGPPNTLCTLIKKMASQNTSREGRPFGHLAAAASKAEALSGSWGAIKMAVRELRCALAVHRGARQRRVSCAQWCGEQTSMWAKCCATSRCLCATFAFRQALTMTATRSWTLAPSTSSTWRMCAPLVEMVFDFCFFSTPCSWPRVCWLFDRNLLTTCALAREPRRANKQNLLQRSTLCQHVS